MSRGSVLLASPSNPDDAQAGRGQGLFGFRSFLVSPIGDIGEFRRDGYPFLVSSYPSLPNREIWVILGHSGFRDFPVPLARKFRAWGAYNDAEENEAPCS